jgi:hypothetical protein
MLVRCPHCGSIIHFENAPSSVVACWMCHLTIERDSIASSPGPPTVTAPGAHPRGRPSAIGLSETAFPEAANPDLPMDRRAKLDIVMGPSRGTEFEITKSITTIGRMGGGADIEIEDPEVSRSHCAIEVRPDGVLLYDLASTNGTYIGGSRVTVIRLEPMSVFRIGLSQLQLKTA